MQANQPKSTDSFAGPARQMLELARGGNLGWSYRRNSEPAVEPTFLACIALLATCGEELMSERGGLQPAGDWVMSLQQPNGAVGVSESLPRPNWPTSLAILLWAALRAHEDRRKLAAKWLLEFKGTTFVTAPTDPVQHDTMIAGWPWVVDTHSWIEPTALAVLALRRQALVDSPRFQDGIRLLVDRAIPTGGWNYGNRVVFGTNLRPQIAPTGLALTALAGLDMPQPACVALGLSYLEAETPKLRAPQSLCWALVALTAWNRRPPQADQWVAESFNRFLRPGKQRPLRGDAGTLVSYLLMGASDKTPALLGISKNPIEKLP